METSPPPRSFIDLPTSLYYQVIHTLTNLLPPPLDNSPQALDVRNKAAVAKVAALRPVNADEVELAAQCIAARAQAEDILRLIRQRTGDIAWITRLNAQYGSMVRTSLSVHGHLMKLQAQRQKREATEGAADQDAWTQHVAERSGLAALDPTTILFKPAWPTEAQPMSPEPERPKTPEPARPTSPEQAPPTSPKAAHPTGPEQARPTSTERARPPSPKMAPIETRPTIPTALSPDFVKQIIEEFVSRIKTNSHNPAFETWLSEQPWNQGSSGPEETALRLFQESMALGRKANAAATANHPSMAG